MTSTERLTALLGEAGWSYMQPWRPRFSSAGDCLRLLVYEAGEARRGARPERVRRPVRWNAAALAGTAIGSMLETAAKRCGAQVQVPVEIAGVTGSCDIVWEDSVWDTKWKGEYAHSLVSRQPSEKDHIQVAGYAAVLGKPKYALINWNLGQLGKGETLDILIDERPTPPDAADRIVATWDSVTAYADRGELPPHGYPQDKCKKLKCRFLEGCWNA